MKLSFFGGLDLARVLPPVENPDNGLRVASLLDLAGTKVKAVQDRAELKDYLDLAALLRHGLGLFDALRAAMTIFGNSFNPLVSLKALVYFEDGDVPGLGDGERRLLETQAAHVDLTGLTPLFFGEDPAGRQSRAQSHTGVKSYASIESETMNTLHKVARRLLWWKTPEDALTDTHRLLAQVMTYGALSDVQVALERCGRTAFLETLLHAPPGVFDARSWRYWHLMFARPVPPLPVRIVTAGH